MHEFTKKIMPTVWPTEKRKGRALLTVFVISFLKLFAGHREKQYTTRMRHRDAMQKKEVLSALTGITLESSLSATSTLAKSREDLTQIS